MPWKSSLPGASLATTLAIEALLRANVSALSDAFAASASFGTPVGASTDVSFLITRFGRLLPACVHRGDLESAWDVGAEGFCKVYVTSGNHRNGVLTNMERAFIGNASQFKDTYTTSIFAYLHQNAFRRQDNSIQEQDREVAQLILSDWLRGVLNLFANSELYLSSQERYDDGDTRDGVHQALDVLSLCQVVMTSQFVREIGPSTFAYGIHALHTGVLQ